VQFGLFFQCSTFLLKSWERSRQYAAFILAFGDPEKESARLSMISDSPVFSMFSERGKQQHMNIDSNAFGNPDAIFWIGSRWVGGVKLMPD
jgi:hypothetical protein